MTQKSEQPEPAFTHETLHDGRVIVYRLTDVRRETVDAYIEHDRKVLENADKDRTLYIIQDVSHRDVSMTPYLRAKLNESMQYIQNNQIHVRSALILPPGIMGRLLQTFGGMLNLRAKYMVQRYFTDEAKARAWIEAEMATEKAHVAS